jgi:hypothetical protein
LPSLRQITICDSKFVSISFPIPFYSFHLREMIFPKYLPASSKTHLSNSS